jgi:cell division protein FtsZ
MSNAGSALMGIGRASGENRAIDAATQAISSPLLEVSIDGARGILFNVIGGLDMSMHEINTVAETITAAADSEANIIFGATINPDLEGEVIVTVVATGFDDSYFATRDAKAADLIRETMKGDEDHRVFTPDQQVDDETMAGINMELKDEEEVGVHDFHKDDDETPNIWALHDEENVSNKDHVEDEEEDELEKPSFLRRFTSRKNRDESEDGEKDEAEDSDDKKKDDSKDKKSTKKK